MSVAQEKAACLRKPRGGAERSWQRELDAWKAPISPSPNVEHLRGQLVPATVQRQCRFAAFPACHFLDIHRGMVQRPFLHVLNAQRNAHQRLSSQTQPNGRGSVCCRVTTGQEADHVDRGRLDVLGKRRNACR
jgi:hypothetical protein